MEIKPAVNKIIIYLLTINLYDTFHPIKIDSLLFFSLLTCYRKRQANAAAAGNNIDDVKTFTVPCNIDVQLDKAMVIRHNNYCYSELPLLRTLSGPRVSVLNSESP